MSRVSGVGSLPLLPFEVDDADVAPDTYPKPRRSKAFRSHGILFRLPILQVVQSCCRVSVSPLRVVVKCRCVPGCWL